MGACCDSNPDMTPVSTKSGISRPSEIGKKVNKKITVEYFDAGYGRAGPLLMLLEHGNVDYEYIQTTQEAWGGRKADNNVGEFGGLPIVNMNGKEFQQTNACMRSLGITHGYYNPTDWVSCGKIDMIVDTYADVFNAVGKILVFTSDEEKP